MRTHESGRLVVRVRVRALHGKMYLTVSEASVDVVDGLHEAFLPGLFVDLVRCKKVQLYSIGVLQISQNDTGLLVLVVLAEESVQQLRYGMNDLRGVVGGGTQFERIIGMVLRKVCAVMVGSKENSDRPAQRTLFAQFAGGGRGVVAQFAQEDGSAARHMREGAAVHDGFLALVVGDGDGGMPFSSFHVRTPVTPNRRFTHASGWRV